MRPGKSRVGPCRRRPWPSVGTETSSGHAGTLSTTKCPISARSVASLRSVDPWNDVWHEHILWTEKYREDCARVFDGRFLDHVPVYAANVNESDIKKAEKVYLLHNLGVPPDTIHECVWAIVG